MMSFSAKNCFRVATVITLAMLDIAKANGCRPKNEDKQNHQKNGPPWHRYVNVAHLKTNTSESVKVKNIEAYIRITTF